MCEKVRDSFAVLFGVKDKDDSSEVTSGVGGEDENDGGNSSASKFAQKWGWTAAIDRVSEVTRTPAHETLDFPIYAFLNWIAYANDKSEDENRRLEEWKRTH